MNSKVWSTSSFIQLDDQSRLVDAVNYRCSNRSLWLSCFCSPVAGHVDFHPSTRLLHHLGDPSLGPPQSPLAPPRRCSSTSSHAR
ncbi:hypothetical protein LINGRAHAP2_LOCUS21095, partial [Linum grandiflorum]